MGVFAPPHRAFPIPKTKTFAAEGGVVLASADFLRQHRPVHNKTDDSRCRSAAALAVWLALAAAQLPAYAAEFVPIVPIAPPAPEAMDAQNKSASEVLPADSAESIQDGTTKMNEVARELRRIADQYGPDSVALQAKFLLRSTTEGARGPVEVKVAGPSEHLGAEYLEIVVDTGLFFDAAQGTLQDRADQVWARLAAPALEEMTSFDLKPAGLELVFLYRVEYSPLPASGQVEGAPAAHAEQLMIALDRALLNSVARDEMAGDALRKAVRFEASAPPP